VARDKVTAVIAVSGNSLQASAEGSFSIIHRWSAKL